MQRMVAYIFVVLDFGVRRFGALRECFFVGPFPTAGLGLRVLVKGFRVLVRGFRV